MPTGGNWLKRSDNDDAGDDVEGHTIERSRSSANEIKGEGHTQEAAAELVRQAEQVQELGQRRTGSRQLGIQPGSGRGARRQRAPVRHP